MYTIQGESGLDDYFSSQDSQALDKNSLHHVFDIDIDTLNNNNLDKFPQKNHPKFKVDSFDDRFILKIYATLNLAETEEEAEAQVFLNESTHIKISLDQLPNIFN